MYLIFYCDLAVQSLFWFNVRYGHVHSLLYRKATVAPIYIYIYSSLLQNLTCTFNHSHVDLCFLFTVYSFKRRLEKRPYPDLCTVWIAEGGLE